jgi:nucleotide-binding universal stress UspA family protein
MSTLYVPSSSVLHAVLREDWPNGIVVGSDGRGPSNAALAAAASLAGPSTFGVIGVLPDAAATSCSPDALSALRESLHDQVDRLLGQSADVWVDIRSGYPPAVLAAYAETHGVSLLVVGIGQARVLDRLNGDESTLRLARMTQTPLFAAAERRHVPPRRIVVGMDLSATSVRAARMAVALAATESEILLISVHNSVDRTPSSGALRRHTDSLQTGFCGRVSAVELHGDAATELLAYASHVNADAIAIGKRGIDRFGRGVLGPVATRIVRCASCSVLLAPPES